MRIVLVNWARIWDGAAFGGGVNQYCQALALELIKRGHDVASLFGGTTFTRRPSGCFIRRHDDWLGVRVFEVINSPVMAPSIVQFARPMGEVSAPELAAQVERLMRDLRPDAVHWNNIEGFSIDCVEAVRRATGGKARNIFSLHNYHTICPQVYLMKKHRETCWSYDQGHDCTDCIPHENPDEARAKMEKAFALTRGGTEMPEAIKEFRSGGGVLVKAVTAGYKVVMTYAQTRGRMPGHAVSSTDDISRALPHPGGPGADTRGKTPHLMAELNPPKPRDPSAVELRPLSNEVRPEPRSAKPLNDYGRRREAMVQMLSSCDRVLAVSDFVRRKFISLGVNERTIRTQAIGSRINRVIDLKPDLVFDPPEPDRDVPWDKVRNLRVHFMGYNNYYKGLHVLAEALEIMDPRHLRKIDLSIFALDGHTIEWMFRRLEPRLGRLHYAYAYNYHDIPWMLGGKDLTVVPSVWWDNAPQTVFESLACGVPVLGANIGGIPDFVTDGHNGLLFTANSRENLRDTLVRAIENPWMVWGLRKNVRPGKSIEAHAVEMEAVYGGTDGA